MKTRILLSFLFISALISCQTEDDLVQRDMGVENLEATEKVKLFKKSVQLTPLINDNLNSLEELGNAAEPAPIEIKAENFNSDYEIGPAFMLNGVAFSDDGKYFDKVAGDGIYTSVQKLRITSKPERPVTFRNSEFSSDNMIEPMGFKISCKFIHDDCPEDGGFWDSDWGTGWGCFYLDSCEVGWES